LPRLAQITLDTLERSGFPSPACVAERAAALAQGPDHVTRACRAASILLANVPLFFALIALSIGLPTAVRLLSTEFLEMSRALVEIRQLDAKTDRESVQAREALELYLADRTSRGAGRGGGRSRRGARSCCFGSTCGRGRRPDAN